MSGFVLVAAPVHVGPSRCIYPFISFQCVLYLHFRFRVFCLRGYLLHSSKIMDNTAKAELTDSGHVDNIKSEMSNIIQLSIDDDIYEDAGDLDFELSPQSMYLSRLPRFLWKTWSQMEDGEELALGNMRVESEHGKIQRVCLS